MALKDYYNTGDDTGGTQFAWSGQWLAQTFVASSSYNAGDIKVLIYRSGTTTTTRVSLYDAADAGAGYKPSGAALAYADVDTSALTTGTGGAWITFTLASPVALTSGNHYALVLRLTSGTGAIYWRHDTDSSGGGYANGDYLYSSNSGSTWTITDTKDRMFEVYSAVVAYAEGTKAIDGTGTVVLSSEDWTGNYPEGTKDIAASSVVVLSTETFSGDILEGTKDIAGAATVALSSQFAEYLPGTLSIATTGSVALALESLRDTINWPPSRPSDYDSSMMWDEDAGTWIAVDGSAGSRLNNTLVVVGQDDDGNGCIYFGGE